MQHCTGPPAPPLHSHAGGILSGGARPTYAEARRGRKEVRTMTPACLPACLQCAVTLAALRTPVATHPCTCGTYKRATAPSLPLALSACEFPHDRNLPFLFLLLLPRHHHHHRSKRRLFCRICRLFLLLKRGISAARLRSCLLSCHHTRKGTEP